MFCLIQHAEPARGCFSQSPSVVVVAVMLGVTFIACGRLRNVWKNGCSCLLWFKGFFSHCNLVGLL
jgi:hypothetical protein